MAVKRTVEVKVEVGSNLFWAIPNTDLDGKDDKKAVVTKNGIIHIGAAKVHDKKGDEIGKGIQAYIELMPIVAKYDKDIPWLPIVVDGDAEYKSEVRSKWTGKRNELVITNDQANAKYKQEAAELFSNTAWDYPEGKWSGKLEDIIPAEMEEALMKLQSLMTTKTFFTILLTKDLKYVTCGDYIKFSDKNVTEASEPTFVL